MIKIIPTPISVELIYADPWKDIIKEAWCNSRPQVNPDEVDFMEILGIDTPVSELAGIVVKMQVPILFREIIFSARDHIAWARTSRVDNLTEQWPILDYADSHNVTHRDILDLMSQLEEDAARGATQDAFRQNLPLSYMTSFTARLSIRSALKLMKYFGYLTKYRPISRAALDMRKKIWEVLEPVLGLNDESMDELLKKIKMEDLCPPYSKPYFNGDSTGKVGDYLVVTTDMPISLRAQVIRHRPITVVDSLNEFFQDPNVWSIPISRQMQVSIGTSIHIWKKIIGKRNCWLAQADLWKDVVDRANHELKGNEFIIPCADGTCPYDGDCKQRIIGKDPGLPCPRHLQLNPFDAVPLFVQESELVNKRGWAQDMFDYVQMSCRRSDYWNTEIVSAVNEVSAYQARPKTKSE